MAGMIFGTAMFCACGMETEEPQAPAEPPTPTPEAEPEPTRPPFLSVHDEALLSPFAPEEMQEIVAAVYYIDGYPYAVTEKKAVERIEKRLAAAQKTEENVGSVQLAPLFLRRADGTEFKLSLAAGKEPFAAADGVFYRYGEERNAELLSPFYSQHIHKLMDGQQDRAMESISWIDWRYYAECYGRDETLKLMDAFGKMVLMGEGATYYEDLLYATFGLENEYADHYAAILTEAYELHKPDFCRMCMQEIDEEAKTQIFNLLASYWAASFDRLTTRFITVINTGY